MRPFYKPLLLSFFFLYIPAQTMAWGMLGHRIVGEIADSYINLKTRKEVKKILGNESIAMASNWADFIKSDSSYNHLSNWHYANFMEDLDYKMLKEALEKETGNNIYNRINFLSAELKKRDLDLNKKQMYLRLLIHLVGDVHQPMHLGRKEDSGGNGIRLSWFNRPTNLHRVWDSDLIDYQQLSYTEYAKAVNHVSAAELKTWLNDDLSVWTFESYQISQQLYATIKPDEKLGYRYNFEHIETLNQRLLKGGVRLGGLLNQVFAGY